MTRNDDRDDDLLFADEDDVAADSSQEMPISRVEPWKIMIVDDDAEVHAVTKVVLSDFCFEGRPLLFISAFSAAEACRLIAEHPDIAVILLDVVMESDDAGLHCVRFIRQNIGNHAVRIILRTGQPGQAPERQVIVDYDINDYKGKSELTAQKLFTAVVAALRSFQHIVSIDMNRRGLEKIIDGSASLFEKRSMRQFVEGVLMQLRSLIQGTHGSLLCTVQDTGTPADEADFQILASTGPFSFEPGTPLSTCVPEPVFQDIRQAFRDGQNIYAPDHSVIVFRSNSHSASVVYISGHPPLGDLDRRLVEIFCSKVAIAFDNVYLYQQVLNAQKATVYALGKLAEYKDEVTGEHVLRVESLTARIAAELMRRGEFPDDLDDGFVDQIGLASILHDVGKVGIPDAVLNKPGKLTDEEMDVIRQHPRIGSTILRDVAGMMPGRSYLSLGAEVAESHHEKYDGSGYPYGLRGDAIPLSGRITAVADVYDALMHRRPYKEAWEKSKVLEFIRSQSGTHFDPRVVDAFLAVVGS
jgi:response regulator RpfG family c-di-GMP phosphodiesterase